MTGSDQMRWGVLSAANIGHAAVKPVIQASANGRRENTATRATDALKAPPARAFLGVPPSSGMATDPDDVRGVDDATVGDTGEAHTITPAHRRQNLRGEGLYGG